MTLRPKYVTAVQAALERFAAARQRLEDDTVAGIDVSRGRTAAANSAR